MAALFRTGRFGLILVTALLGLNVQLVAAQCLVTTLAGGGATGIVSGSDNGVGTAALFNGPFGIAVAVSGTVFVVDVFNHKIRAITPNGTVTTLAGGSTTGIASGSNNGVGTAALFNGPRGIAVAPSGVVFVGDQGNHKVRAILPNGTVTTLAGGSTTGTASGVNDGIGTAALFYTPQGVAVAASGTVFVVDASNHKIRAITPNGTVTTLAGGSTTGIVSGSNNGVGTAALFNGPSGVAVDVSGTVLVGDNSNHKIRAITPNGTVTTLAGGSFTGTSIGSNNGVGTAALFNNPACVAVDALGVVFVGDYGNHKIRAILPNGTVTTLAGGSTTGTATGSNNGIGTAALFYVSVGVAVATSGTMFVADYGNHKIRVLVNCLLCPPGYFCSDGTSATAQLCPAGHYCPAGSTHWNDKNCGRSFYCPWGSSAPISCGPKGAIDTVLGPANGPAWLSDVAACKNHCYFGAPGELSTCE